MPSANYRDRQELNDSRGFAFGSIWKVDDRNVAIPQVDRMETRNFHDERWVVVISNNRENYHPLCPVVTVAPLSHRVDLKRPYDLELFRERDNVKVDCLLQLKLAQPILKVDLYENKKEISEQAMIELQALIEDYFNITYED